MPAATQPAGAREARALGGRTRHAIFRHLVAADRPVDVIELSAHFGLNHNGIRRHLAHLVDAGLVDQHTAPATGRGRPRLTYTACPRTTPYERLSLLLLDAVRSGDRPVEVGRRSAQPSRSGSGLDGVVHEIAAHGFDPVVHPRRSGADVELRVCPFERAAVADPELVCGIHRGMVEGLADHTDGAVTVEDLIAVDPRSGSCRLRLRLAEEARHV